MSVFERFAPQAKGFTGNGNNATQVVFGSQSDSYSAQRTARISDAVADISFVYEVQRQILNYAAPVPIKAFALDATGEREEDLTHPAYQLLRQPNPRHDEQTFREYLFASRLNYGEHFIVMQRDDRGRVVALWPLRPDRMQEVTEDGELLGFMLNYASSNPVPILLQDLIWGTSYHPSNDLRGLSPISALRWQIELGRDAEQTMVDLYANSAFLKGALKMGRKAGGDSMKRIAREFRDLLIGSGNRFRIPVFEEGMEFVPIQLNPQDAEFLNTAKLTRARVANALGWALPEEYPSAQPGDLRRLRFNDAVVPVASAIQASINKTLMPEYAGSAFVEFQLAHILNADFPTLVEAGKTAIYSALMTPNEYRRKYLNLPPLDGGDDLFVPLNLSPVNDLAPNPRPADSGGGMGGDEGRTESTASAPTPIEAKSAASRYGEASRRKQERLAKALGNRVRGILKRELEDITNTGKAAALPTALQLQDIIARHDPELSKLIHQFLDQSAVAAAASAGHLTGMDPIDHAQFAGLFSERADAVATQFGAERGSWLMDLLAQAQAGDLEQRDFMNAVADGYGEKFSHYGERLARTEVAYGHEAAARASWAAAGASGVVWNYGGGPCTTGDCEALNGVVAPIGGQFDSESFGGIDGPPSHNYCTCYTTPTFDSLTPAER